MASKVSKKKTQHTPLTLDTITFSPCNYIALLDHNDKYPDFHIIADFLRKCPLHKALTYSPKMSKFLLGNFWATCVYDKTTKEVHASVLSSNDVSFNVDDLRRVLDLPTYSPYEEFASVDDLNMVVKIMGYVQDPKVKSHGTLYRKCMGGVWNFFFSHLTYCLSSRTGGMDQSPSWTIQLAHALIFQKKIDFAQHFFDKFVKRMESTKGPVPFIRFFSMMIADKLGSRMPADVDNYYDLKVSQIGFLTLKKASLPTELPLPSGMVSFANSPNPVWGASSMSTNVDAATKNISKSVGPIPILGISGTDYRNVTSLAKKKVIDSFIPAFETMNPKEPSESHLVSHPSKIKRRPSKLFTLGSSSKKAKKTRNTSQTKDSQMSKLGPSSLVPPSEQDTVVQLGIPHHSSSTSLHDLGVGDDDSDTSHFKGLSSPPHGHCLSPEIDNLDDIARVDDTSATTAGKRRRSPSPPHKVVEMFDTLAGRVTVMEERQDADSRATSDHTRTLTHLEERIDGFSTTLSRTNQLLADFVANHLTFVSNVFKDIKSHNDQADVRASVVTSAITDLSAKISDISKSNSERPQYSLADLNARVTALSDSQSTILTSLADLRARSDTQAEVNQTILCSLADLHAKVDAQTQISKSTTLQKQFDEANRCEVEQSTKEMVDSAELIEKVKTEKRIKWYNYTTLCRYISAPIMSVEIKGPQKLTYDSDKILLIIGRDNGVVRTEKISWMRAYGVSEWIETIKFIDKSQSMYREHVLSHFDWLMEKILIIKKHYKLSAPPQLSLLKSLLSKDGLIRSDIVDVMEVDDDSS